MFRKTWKTLKYILIGVILIIIVPHSILPRRNSGDTAIKSGNQNSDKIKSEDFTKPLSEDTIRNYSGTLNGNKK